MSTCRHRQSPQLPPGRPTVWRPGVRKQGIGCRADPEGIPQRSPGSPAPCSSANVGQPCLRTGYVSGTARCGAPGQASGKPQPCPSPRACAGLCWCHGTRTKQQHGPTKKRALCPVPESGRSARARVQALSPGFVMFSSKKRIPPPGGASHSAHPAPRCFLLGGLCHGATPRV